MIEVVTLHGGPLDGRQVERLGRYLSQPELLAEHPDYPDPFDETEPIARWQTIHCEEHGPDAGCATLVDRWPKFLTHRYDLATGQYLGVRHPKD